jgi:hypothetical protein
MDGSAIRTLIRPAAMAAVTAAGLAAATALAASGTSAAPHRVAGSDPQYTYYRSMMGRYHGGMMMGGGPGRWMMGADGYRWIWASAASLAGCTACTPFPGTHKREWPECSSSAPAPSKPRTRGCRA